jgi:hypothetical protein
MKNYKETKMKNKIIYKITALLMSSALLMSCSANSGNQTTIPETETENTEVNLNIKTMSQSMVEYEDDDYYTDWEGESPNYIKLNGSSAEFEGTGAVIKEGTITINSPGTYVVSGILSDGQIIVNADSKDTVRIVLNGAQISCSDNSPIYVASSEKTIISLVENTENSVADGSTYVLADGSDEPNASIYSKDNLTINGAGKLTVNSNYNNGINGKDQLKVTGGTIIINSVDDGLLGKDLVAVKNADITINAKGDGIKATNDTEDDKGNMVLESGTFIVTAGSDGIQTEKNLSVFDGTYQISSTEDAIHSNSTINIYGGTFEINSEDDGIHADSSIDISGGTINIIKSYEGIESALVNISGGNINLAATDDGINVAGGMDSSSVNGRPGQNSFASTSDNKLTITGGNIAVDAAGDGLDANGSIYMDGGTVIVNGPTNNGNGSLDYDQTFEMNGGVLMAAGSSGMVQTPSDSSTQNSLLISYSQMQQAGTVVKILDESGNTVVEFTPNKTFQAVLLSSQDLKLNTAYQLYSQDSKTADFTLTKNIMTISETGEEVTAGGFGQPGQGGGRGMKPGMQNGEVPTMPEGERPAEFQENRQMPDGTSGATQETGIPSDTEDSEATV